ncbi:sodium:calcium antiporter [bacterium]|nr:sodium:calcium antiporter [bacterium]
MQVCFEFFGAFFLLALIVFACSLFTNAVEHFGLEFKFGKNAIGSIFAALGTTAPETIVPLVAIIGGILAGDESVACEIGVGAILGSPFLLSTITFFFMGVGIYIFKWAKARKSIILEVNNRYIIRDFKFFFVNYFVAIGASFVKFPLVKFLALLFLIISYVYYFVQTLSSAKNSDDIDTEIEELALAKICKFNKRAAIFIQVILSLILLILCAHLFVLKIKFFADFLHIQPLILSLIIMPIATELPENVNSLLWLKHEKDTFALSNITGAMVFQSAIPMSIGILFTPWVFDVNGLVNIVCVILSSVILYFAFVCKKQVSAKMFLLGGLFYLAFIVFVLRNIF